LIVLSVLSGKDTSMFVAGIEPNQIQPNGVDLTLDKVFTFSNSGTLLKDNVVLPDYSEEIPDTKGYYNLSKGVYIFQVKEKISVPLNAIGFCLPRSSLIRMGADIGAALWDSGYTGFSKILLRVENPIVIEKGARIVQFILIKSENEVNSGYSGRYQNE